MGQKLTYMVHKDKIWTSRGKIVKLKQFLKLHPQYCVLSIIEMFVLVSCTNREPHWFKYHSLRAFIFVSNLWTRFDTLEVDLT